MLSDTTNCKNCNDLVMGKFCGNCGLPGEVERIDFHYISHELQHILHFEKGFLYTLKELLLRPGQSIREFITENRSRLVKPLLFVIVTSLIYTLVDHFFKLEEKHIEMAKIKSSHALSIFVWMNEHRGYSNIIESVFIAYWTKRYFKSYQYNFFEILILLCFAEGMAMNISTVFSLLEGITKINLFVFSSIASVGYSIWAMGQFFDKKKFASYRKSFFAYIVGILCFSIVVATVGFSLDLIFKH